LLSLLSLNLLDPLFQQDTSLLYVFILDGLDHISHVLLIDATLLLLFMHPVWLVTDGKG
jgi:hypothetical protein